MSIHFEVNRTFRVSQDKTFASLLDLDSAKLWMQGLVSIERDWMKVQCKSEVNGRKHGKCTENRHPNTSKLLV